MSQENKEHLEKAASFRPHLNPPVRLALVMKDAEILELKKELEIERRENSRLRERLNGDSQLQKDRK